MSEPIYFLDYGGEKCPPAAEAALRQKLREITAPIATTSHFTRTTFHLERMDCPVEEQLIRNRLRSENGISQLHFDLLQRRLTVEHERDANQLLNILDSLGMEPHLIDETAPKPREKSSRRDWLQLGAAGILAAGAETWAIAIRSDHAVPVMALSIGALLLSGRAPLQKAWLALKNRTLNIYVLMALAVGGALIIQHWPEAAMVTVLFALSELIEAQALGRARRAIQELEALAPDTAEVLHGEHWHEMAASNVEVGQIARVRPGGRIPLDGHVHEGQSAVNQAPVTGESVPVEKSRGDEVFAGSINGQGSFTFEVTRTQNDSTIARIARAVQEAQAQRAPVQRFVDSFARIYTPLVVLAALFFATIPPLLFGGAWNYYFYHALVMLVIACPCALVISTPVTIVSGLTLAARRGLIIKGGLYLEQGRNLRALAFDKTGTLTIGRPQITQIIALTQDEKSVLQIAASLNSLSEHPLAVAFWEKWQVQGGKALTVTNFVALPGRGVRGEIEDQSFWLGNLRLAQENDAELPPIGEELENAGQTVVFLGQKQEIMALFALSDAPRPEAAQVIAQLKAQGIMPILLSGDNARVVSAVGKQLGITRQHGELLPEEKLNAIAELESEFGAIGMMGDGINDAPALARATIGFCPGAAGTAVALETADVALLQDDLRLLPLFFKISRATLRVLWQNIALALGIKVLFFALALAGYATLWMAVFADVGASLLVILNGLRLLRLKIE